MNDILILILAAILGFVISAIGGKFWVPFWQQAGAKQKISKFNIESHQKKGGTPTFGGSIFLTSFVILAIIYLIIDFNPLVLAIVLFTVAHAVIGFIDDYVNVKVNSIGLSDKAKGMMMLVVQVFFIAYYLYGNSGEIRIVWPFGIEPTVVSSWGKIIYGLFLLFYFFACTNAVNIIDGIDGLSSSTTSVVLIYTGITALLLHRANTIESGFGLSVLSFIMFGALLGFLIYNWHKAKIFMGDMGSLALGALVSSIFLVMEMPWAFAIAGIMYVIDIATVLIQRSYFKITGGKRLPMRTPIHHDFEEKGWKEEKVVTLFTVGQTIGCILAALLTWTII